MSFLFKGKKKRQSGDGVDDACLHPTTKLIREWFASREKVDLSLFTLGPTLGTGTFGRVRLASAQIDGTTYYMALKMLKKTEIIRLKQVEHIKDEKQILNSICHPFIVNFYASFQDEVSLAFMWKKSALITICITETALYGHGVRHRR